MCGCEMDFLAVDLNAIRLCKAYRVEKRMSLCGWRRDVCRIAFHDAGGAFSGSSCHSARSARISKSHRRCQCSGYSADPELQSPCPFAFFAESPHHLFFQGLPSSQHAVNTLASVHFWHSVLFAASFANSSAGLQLRRFFFL